MGQIREAQGLTGELTWITCRSRPDIAFSISRIARMVSKRPVAATKAAKQVIGYLIATRGYRLRYGGETDPELNSHLLQSRDIRIVESFSDASFGCDSGRSQSGVVVLFGGCPVGWLSLTQPFTTLSTCEAELVAACEGLAVTQALLPLWREIAGVIPTWLAYSDSISCTAILMYPSGNWRTKHLRLRAKVYQELVEEGLLLLTHIPGRLQVADLLTKSLSKSRMDDLLRFLGYGGLPVKAEVSAEDPSSLRIISAGNDIEWGTPGTGGVAKFLRLAILSGLPELVQAQGNEPLWIVQVRWCWVLLGVLLMIALILWQWYQPGRDMWRRWRWRNLAQQISQEEPALMFVSPPCTGYSSSGLGLNPLSVEIQHEHESLDTTSGLGLEETGNLDQDIQPNLDSASQGVCLATGWPTLTHNLDAGCHHVHEHQTVDEYLAYLNLGHLLGVLRDIGIDELDDFRYVFVEDLVEMGLTYEDAQRILAPFHASNHHRPEGPWPAGTRGCEVPLLIQGGKLAFMGVRGRRVVLTPRAREAEVPRRLEGWTVQPVQPFPASAQPGPIDGQPLSQAAPPRSSPFHPWNTAPASNQPGQNTRTPSPLGFSPNPVCIQTGQDNVDSNLRFRPEPEVDPNATSSGQRPERGGWPSSLSQCPPEPLSVGFSPQPNPVFQPSDDTQPEPLSIGFSPEGTPMQQPNISHPILGFSPEPVPLQSSQTTLTLNTLRFSPTLDITPGMDAEVPGEDSEAEEADGNFCQVLSLNCTLLLWFLGDSLPSFAALAFTTESMYWAVCYAQEMLNITGPRLHPLRPLLALIGITLIQLLGPEEVGLRYMRGASASFRWGIAFAFCDYNDVSPPSSLETSEESTSSDGSGSTTWSHETFANAAEDFQLGDSADETSAGDQYVAAYVDDYVGGHLNEDPTELDHQIAGAAAFLTQNGLDVNWQQLSDIQQELYHELIGLWLQRIHEVD